MAKVLWNPEKLNILTLAQQRLVKVGFELERDVKQSFKPGTGEIYMKGKNKNIAHQASAPGETPAVDTGRLRASISTNWTNSGLSRGAAEKVATSEESDGIGAPDTSTNKFRVVVGTNITYGPYLEFGTSMMAARPFMRPALERIKGRFSQFFKGK